MLGRNGHEWWSANDAGLADEGQDDNLTVYASEHRAVLVTLDREFSRRRQASAIGWHVRLRCPEPDAAVVLASHLKAPPGPGRGLWPGKRRRRESNPCTGLCRPLPKPLGHSATEVPRPATATAASGRPAMEPENRGLVPDGVRRLRADDGIRTRDPHLGKVMLYQLSHVRVPAMGLTARRTVPACEQNCSRSWPGSKLGFADPPHRDTLSRDHIATQCHYLAGKMSTPWR